MEDYEPTPLPERVSHYYGDIVRQIFILTAAVMLLGAPFYADSLRAELPFEIAGAVVLVALAALANPHNRTIFLGSAVASAIGLIVYETWALYSYAESFWIQFILRQIIAVLFLIAFYFSMKTLRAFMLGKIGKHDTAGEFDEKR